MSHRNSFAAIKEIKSWSVDDVINVLNKNGLESTCAAFQKREIDGENLLDLTEGKLALWKRDLSLADIRNLSRFMNELNKSPERFLLIENNQQNGGAKHMAHTNVWKLPAALPPLPPRPHSPTSDTGSWDTDFEDDHDPTEDVYSEPPDEPHPPLPLKPNPGFLYSASVAAVTPQPPYTRSPAPANGLVKPPIARRPAAVPAKTWSNPPGNASALFSLPKPPTPQLENLISNLNLRESKDQDEYEEEEYASIEEGVGFNLQSLGFPPRVPPVELPSRKITPAEQPPFQSLTLPSRKITPTEQPTMGLPPRKLTPAEQPPFQSLTLPSRKITPEQPSLESIQASSPNPYPKFPFNATRSRSPAFLPPTSPAKQEEPHFNNIPAGIPNQMSALSNKNQTKFGLKPPMPLPVYNHGSNLSIDTVGSYEQEDYEPEDYECIENPQVAGQGDTYYLQPVISSVSVSPTLPTKAGKVAAVVPDIVTPSSRPPSPPRKKSFPDDAPSADGTGDKLSDKLRNLMKMRQVSTISTDEPVKEKSPMPELQKPPPVERPGPGPRPLPPTPDATRKPGQDKMNPRRNSRAFTQMPWYHNVDRKRAEELLKNGEDGKFLLRPSLQTQNPLTLTLWYTKRLYNISVRQRTDQRYALGTEKPNEQSFNSVEELVQHYQGEELVLYSGGERTGKTILTSSPPRQSS